MRAAITVGHDEAIDVDCTATAVDADVTTTAVVTAKAFVVGETTTVLVFVLHVTESAELELRAEISSGSAIAFVSSGAAISISPEFSTMISSYAYGNWSARLQSTNNRIHITDCRYQAPQELYKLHQSRIV